MTTRHSQQNPSRDLLSFEDLPASQWSTAPIFCLPPFYRSCRVSWMEETTSTASRPIPRPRWRGAAASCIGVPKANIDQGGAKSSTHKVWSAELLERLRPTRRRQCRKGRSRRRFPPCRCWQFRRHSVRSPSGAAKLAHRHSQRPSASAAALDGALYPLGSCEESFASPHDAGVSFHRSGCSWQARPFAGWHDLTQNLQPSRPAVACNIASAMPSPQPGMICSRGSSKSTFSPRAAGGSAASACRSAPTASADRRYCLRTPRPLPGSHRLCSSGR
jgi:hypothetical protein